MTDLQHSTREEPNARCNVCAMGLSWVESFLYGNRCVLCVEHKQKINLITLLALVIFDWIIYNVLLKISKRENAKMILIGSLGEVGYFDLNQIRTISGKVVFLLALKRCARRLK